MERGTRSDAVPIDDITVSTYTIPTDTPDESDGTAVWPSTTLVLVEATGGGQTGLGYTYADSSTARLIYDTLAGVALGRNVMMTGEIWRALVTTVRNLGRTGIASMAISAIDVAVWDLRARLFDVPLPSLVGAARAAVPAYGSGGFTSYTSSQLVSQLACWVQQGFRMVKMKIGRDAAADVERVAAARRAIGDDVELFVDANGAYERKQALAQAARFVDSSVTWFEEPVYHRDVDGLRFCRDRAPRSMEIAAGEYGYAPDTFAALVGAVDVVQADATRCEGITGFLAVDGLCEATSTPLSAHCAPALHAHLGCAAKRVRHVEYFHDHARVERLLFDGVVSPRNGALCPDLDRPGLGLELKRSDARRFASS